MIGIKPDSMIDVYFNNTGDGFSNSVYKMCKYIPWTDFKSITKKSTSSLNCSLLFKTFEGPVIQISFYGTSDIVDDSSILIKSCEFGCQVIHSETFKELSDSAAYYLSTFFTIIGVNHEFKIQFNSKFIAYL